MRPSTMLATTPTAPDSRCPVCAARALEARGRGTTCAWCGAAWRGSVRARCDALSRRLVPGQILAEPAQLGGLVLDDYTLRMAATAALLRFRPARGEIIGGHSDRPGEGVLEPLAGDGPGPITLVVLSASDDPRLVPLVQQLAFLFYETLVVLDPREVDVVSAPLEAVSGVRRLTRPLQRFDTARNLAQAAASTPFTFHLDTDETVSQRLLAHLGSLASLADAAGLEAIGLPRNNIVDGVRSDLYPDVQYRLVRRGVRFEGAVHERPCACRHWPSTMVALVGAIDHHVSRAHVAHRRARYDRMGQSAERGREIEALLTPYAA